MKTAYPNTISPVTITLYRNFPFDNTYKDHSFIYDFLKRYKLNGVTKTEHVFQTEQNTKQECFLDVKHFEGVNEVYDFPRTTKTDVFNFDFSNGLIATITLELTAEETNSNYMQVVSGTGNTAQKWFYFITGIKQVNADTYTLNLELDVIMTYGRDFMDGISNAHNNELNVKNVMTKRKHCRRFTDNDVPYCADFKNGDSTFNNVKPNIVKDVVAKHFDAVSDIHELEGIMWLYVCVDVGKGGWNTKDIVYTSKGKTFPFGMICIPVNAKSITYSNLQGSISRTYSRTDILNGIGSLIGSGIAHGAKISPYPPFKSGSATCDSENNITLKGNLEVLPDSSNMAWWLAMGNNRLLFLSANLTPIDNSIIGFLLNGFVAIAVQDDMEYTYADDTTNFGITSLTLPAINQYRLEDPKLLFKPFRSYKINAQYDSDGCEFYPEFACSDYPLTKGTSWFNLCTISTAYIGDNNFFTYLLPSRACYSWYPQSKIGLASSVNYIFPVGTNALDVFNATQAQSFYQSKVASGITSGLTMASGIASIAIGSGMTIASSGALSPIGMAMVAGGVAGVASGTAGIANTIASSVSKIDDLKNTPNSINVSGSNFITDDAITNNLNLDTHGLPYITIMECSKVIKKCADDFFYKYGYEVARDCIFNRTIEYNMGDSANYVDCNLFTRTVFNYIQLDEDITMKIMADIPLIAKQKLASIFMKGITLWTFLGFQKIANGQAETKNSGYWFNAYLYRTPYENAEYRGGSY